MTVLEKAARYWRTVRHLQAKQVAWRVRRVLVRRLGMSKFAPRPRRTPDFDRVSLRGVRAYLDTLAAACPPDPETAEALRRGRFSFLHQTVEKPGDPPWNQAGLPRLWRYHLHYFDIARELAVANAAQPYLQDRERVLAWIHSWISANPPGTDVAWDAFPTAARLVNWAFAESVFQFRDEAMRNSFAQQAHYLARHIEIDVQANHLLKDAVGLVVAGSVLGGRPLETGLALLESQLAEQVLPDGGHYERSPMYHALVLEDLIIAYAALEEKPAFLRTAIERMTRFLPQVLHPDGEIPLFGDAALGHALPPAVLFEIVRSVAGIEETPRLERYRALADSGFYVMDSETPGSRMIVKAGGPGPGYQLGHAHNDMLSYELSIEGKRWIVDSGVHGYAGSPWRGYCRSTRAHNTVSVNNGEPLECWDVFRVGRRYSAEPVSWEEHALGWILRGAHDGFAPVRHQRTLLCAREGFWLVLDAVTGPGELNAESFIHFLPRTELFEEAGHWTARRLEGALRIQLWKVEAASVFCGEETPRQGWYCPGFGQAFPAPVLCLRTRGASRLCFGYVIVPAGVSVLAAESLNMKFEELAAYA